MRIDVHRNFQQMNFGSFLTCDCYLMLASTTKAQYLRNEMKVDHPGQVFVDHLNQQPFFVLSKEVYISSLTKLLI